jgi:polar amino acid transport system substrate-binding protein
MFKNNVICIFTFFAFIALPSYAATPENTQNNSIKVLADDSPFLYQQGPNIRGSSYQIVEQLFEEAGLNYYFELKPWARVYKEGLMGNNIMISGLGRTPKRDPLFHWIGPVNVGINVHFYQLESQVAKINSIQDIKEYKVAVEGKTYNHDYLVTENFEQRNLLVAVDSKQLLKLLVRKRAQFIIMSETDITALADELGYDLSLFKKALYGFKVAEYLAMSKNSDEILVKKLQQSYQRLSNAGVLKLGKTQ